MYLLAFGGPKRDIGREGGGSFVADSSLGERALKPEVLQS